MALALVQAKKIETGSANTVTVNAALTATSGNLMVAGIVEFNSSSATGAAASDNANGAYTQINESTAPAGVNIRASLLYKANISGGSLNLTANGGTSAGAVTASFQEVSGSDTTAPYTTGEQTSGSGTGNANTQTANVTNSVADSIFFALMGNASGNNPATLTVNSTGSSPTGWALKSTTDSQETNGSALQTLSMPYLIVSSSAATKHGWTADAVETCWSMACFKMASGVSFDPSVVPWSVQLPEATSVAVIGF